MQMETYSCCMEMCCIGLCQCFYSAGSNQCELCWKIVWMFIPSKCKTGVKYLLDSSSLSSLKTIFFNTNIHKMNNLLAPLEPKWQMID